jgi:hypothetical protein
LRINGDIKRNSIFAAILGLFLALVIVGSVVLIPNLNLFGSSDPDSPEQQLNIGSVKLGMRIANYMENRANDVVFVWCYNNTAVNVNLTNHYGVFVDGVAIYETNVTIFNVEGVDSGIISSSAMGPIVDALNATLDDLNTTAPNIDVMDIWPPTFLWDIAYSDKTSLSLMYSKDQGILAAVNGTWTMSEWILPGGVIMPFPQFEYAWLILESAFLVLDEEAETAVLSAIQFFIELIMGAVE